MFVKVTQVLEKVFGPTCFLGFGLIPKGLNQTCHRFMDQKLFEIMMQVLGLLALQVADLT